MSLAGLVAAALFGAAVAFSAAAQDAARGAATSAERRGAAMAAERCAACHGADGRSAMEGTPSLAGQPALFITTQMILFREGLRQVPAMTAVASGMADGAIEDLAAHFASLPPGPPRDRRARDPALFAAGQALIGPRNCAVCHLPSLTGREQVPRLIGQREEFLARTMVEYRDGVRVGADSQMNGAVVGLTDAQIAALAHYLAQRE